MRWSQSDLDSIPDHKTCVFGAMKTNTETTLLIFFFIVSLSIAESGITFHGLEGGQTRLAKKSNVRRSCWSLMSMVEIRPWTAS